MLVLTRATLRLSCRTVEHGARIIKQNRRGSFRSVDKAGSPFRLAPLVWIRNLLGSHRNLSNEYEYNARLVVHTVRQTDWTIARWKGNMISTQHNDLDLIAKDTLMQLYNNYIKMMLFRWCFTKLIRFKNNFMYLMFNMIHTDVLKFIEHIIFINIAILESILNLIFIKKFFYI